MKQKTANDTIDQKRFIIDRIFKVHHELISSASLFPSRKINTLFSQLVRSVIIARKISFDDLLKNKKIKKIIPSLQKLCSDGEYFLEKKWAQDISISKDPRKILMNFPYLEYYRKLIASEFQEFTTLKNTECGRALFVGSGPLPLSSIILAEQYGISVDAVDKDIRACEMSQTVINQLFLNEKIRVLCKDALEIKNITSYNLIIIAALAGETAEKKKEILKHFATYSKKDTVLVIRSAKGPAILLYRPVSIKGIRDIKTEKVIHPTGEVINSTIIAKKL